MTEQVAEEPLFSTEEIDDTEPYVGSPTPSEREVFTTTADPDVETILNRIEDKSLILRPEFQRASVWDNVSKSRLIESLLLNLPIPPVFLAEDPDGTRVVVDGQQRLNAVDDYYHGRYALKGLQVLSDLNGKKWAELPPKLDRKILQRVIRTIVISPFSAPQIRFEIFERLNTGGVPLTEQEIRNATLRGSFNNLLNSLAHSKEFLEVLGITKPDVRLRHHELILRFFAVNAVLEDYRPPLKMILTNYMKQHREPSADEIAGLRKMFLDSLSRAALVFRNTAFRRLRDFGEGKHGYEKGVSRAVFELQMITFQDVATAQLKAAAPQIEKAFQDLSLNNQPFADALARATDHRSRFYLRMRTWAAALQAVGLQPPFAKRLPPENS